VKAKAEFDLIICASYSPRELRVLRGLAEAMTLRFQLSPAWSRTHGRSV
jgi:hypothetical protein